MPYSPPPQPQPQPNTAAAAVSLSILDPSPASSPYKYNPHNPILHPSILPTNLPRKLVLDVTPPPLYPSSPRSKKDEPAAGMVTLRCGGGAAAYLAAQRIASPQDGDGRSAVLSVRAGTRELPLGASSSPSSLSPRTVRCSAGAGPPHRVKRRCFQNKGVPEGWGALKAAAADMFRPLRLNLSGMRSINTVYDLTDYQIGMLYGAIAGCLGVYQLWKASPPIFVDAALGYIIYKLSVISSELHRQRKSNSFITRLQFGFILFMALKDHHKKYVLLDAIRLPLFFLYLGAFVFDVAGLKKYGRRILISFVNLLKRRGGIEEIFRIVWWRGYVSPYDD